MQKTPPVMEVWLVCWMAQSPITQASASVFQNHGQGNFRNLCVRPPGLEWNLNGAAATNTIHAEVHFRGFRQWLCNATRAVTAELINVPVSVRRNIYLPVPFIPRTGKKGFETGVPPEVVLPLRSVLCLSAVEQEAIDAAFGQLRAKTEAQFKSSVFGPDKLRHSENRWALRMVEGNQWADLPHHHRVSSHPLNPRPSCAGLSSMPYCVPCRHC